MLNQKRIVILCDTIRKGIFRRRDVRGRVRNLISNALRCVKIGRAELAGLAPSHPPPLTAG